MKKMKTKVQRGMKTGEKYAMSEKGARGEKGGARMCRECGER